MGAGTRLPLSFAVHGTRMPDRHHRAYRSSRGENVFAACLFLFLALCWALGGVTVDSTSADEMLQLLSLPLLPWAAWRVAGRPLARIDKGVMVSLLLVVVLPLAQLLPLPSAVALAGDARQALVTDLAHVGVAAEGLRASLLPQATERSLWSLLPAVALCLGGLSLSHPSRRRLLQGVLGLALASATFAFFQLSLPNGSPLLLFGGERNFGGLFINRNHQGSALAIGAVIATALFIDGHRRAGDEEGSRRHWAYAFVAAACLLMVPLANGSAAMLLVLVGPLATWLLLRSSAGRQRLPMWLATAAVATIVLTSAMAWRQVDVDRRFMAAQTLEIGSAYAPMGAGIGNFVAAFDQQDDTRHPQANIVNHAHNEYVQWWLEGGFPALLLGALALAAFARAGWQAAFRTPSRRQQAVAVAAWTSLLVLLLHSLVDYPLRTTTLMASAGLLAGLLFASLAEATREIRSRVHRDDATQQA